VETSTICLSPGLVSEVVEEVTLWLDVLNVSTIVDNHLVRLQLLVVGPVESGETPLLGDDDLLPSWELVSGTPESLHDDGLVGVLATDGHDDLTNVDTSGGTDGFTPSATHTLLESIGTSTGQHLVDPQDVEGVDTNTQVEGILSGSLDDVLVGADTGGFQSLRTQLLIFIRYQMTTEWEIINGCTFTT